MSNERVVIQITIVVNGDGQTVLKTVVGENDGGTVVVGSGGGSVTGGGAGGGTVTGTGTGTGTSTTAGHASAQRTVHIVAGNGGLAWFTLVWPVPGVITNFQPTFSFDDPAKATLVPGTGADHPLYARKMGARYLWEGRGAHSQPTVFVAGTNQTHTSTPQTTTIPGSSEMIAAGAALQSGLGATMPALAFSGLSYGPATGAPALTAVPGVDAAIAALKALTPLSPQDEQDLKPSAAQLAGCGITAATPAVLVNLASSLLFTANAFRRNLLSTVLLPAFNDDPHGAFAAGNAEAAGRADALAAILDAFYAELASHPEPKAQDGTLSLADNVVLVVSGDTPKSPFNRNGWPDGTPGQANLLYVRSNGYLKPGWFGLLDPTTGRTNFDPVTGTVTAGSQAAPATAAALAGVLFAIARGNTAAVTTVTSAPFAGVVSPSLP